MKKIYTIGNRTVLMFSALACLFFFISSCATKASFQSSSIVPAAQGSIKVKKDDNDNYSINININHLARPDELTPSRKVFVVWMETDDNGTKNIGQINSNKRFLSGKRTGSFNSVTPFKPTKIYITAEDDAKTVYPSNEIVLTTKSF